MPDQGVCHHVFLQSFSRDGSSQGPPGGDTGRGKKTNKSAYLFIPALLLSLPKYTQYNNITQKVQMKEK